MHFEAIKEICRSGPVTIEVNGDCMGTLVPHGCQIKAQQAPYYWPGDIVVFARGDDRMVSHRLLGYFPGRKGWNALTRAATANMPDAPVPASRIIGKVVLTSGKPLATDLLQRLKAFGQFASGLMYLIRTRVTNQR